MAGRPPKEKLDYYSMEDGWIHDYKIRRIVRTEGYAGLGFYSYLLHEVYHRSYYVRYDEDFIFNASDYGNVEEEQIINWVDKMVKHNLIKVIDTEEGKVITSTGIQKRYLFIRRSLKRASKFIPKIGIWLLKEDENSIMDEKTGAKLNYDPENEDEIELCSTETGKGKRKGKETETGKEKEGSVSELDDNTVLSDSLISRLKSEGLDVGKNTEDWIANAIRVHGADTIKGKFEEGLEGYKVGEIRNPVGWVIKQMESYMIPFTEPKPKRKKPDPDCPICHGEGGFFRKTILNGVEGAGEWVQCECTKPMQDVKEM